MDMCFSQSRGILPTGMDLNNLQSAKTEASADSEKWTADEWWQFLGGDKPLDVDANALQRRKGDKDGGKGGKGSKGDGGKSGWGKPKDKCPVFQRTGNAADMCWSRPTSSNYKGPEYRAKNLKQIKHAKSLEAAAPGEEGQDVETDMLDSVLLEEDLAMCRSEGRESDDEDQDEQESCPEMEGYDSVGVESWKEAAPESEFPKDFGQRTTLGNTRNSS